MPRTAKAPVKPAATRKPSPSAPSRPDDLVKPSVLAKELGTYLSVIYGMIKRGSIRDYRTGTDQSSMVSRSEVEQARANGKGAARKARAEKIANGEAPEPEVKKSPLKAGQVLTKAKTSYSKSMPQENRRSFNRVQEVLTDSETGLAVAVDSAGREFYWDADDAKAMLTDGRLVVADRMWLLDAVGGSFVAEGRDDLADSLASWIAANLDMPAPKKRDLVAEQRAKDPIVAKGLAKKTPAPAKKLTAVERQREARARRS